MSGDAPIIIKKVVKGHGGGHHGGAWKVAYADFVTAMMAFFLLLWLLNVTTDEQKSGIADYFAPTTASRSTSGSGGVLGGTSLAVDGARISNASPATVVVELTPPKQRDVDESADDITEEELMQEIAEREQAQFQKAEAELRQAIQDSPNAGELQKHLIVDNTPEGLRIQLVDQDRNSMFSSGSNVMSDKARQLMQKVVQVVRKLPNRISITGHTDSTKFRGNRGYGNWELSADRANASRRALIEYGLQPERINHVSGKADTEPLIPEDPSLPTNRRISITLLREVPALPPSGAN